MIINKVTITGADNNTDFNDLVKLQEKYPFVEWAILYSKSKDGQHRYPTLDHVKEQIDGKNLNLAAHFCGWWANEVLEKQNYDLITELDIQFKRVQLNYNFNYSNRWNLNNLVIYAKENPSREIILQYNHNNADVLNELMEKGIPTNIQFLYDASGGRGTEIKAIEKPFDGVYTGYAGGLNTDNIGQICDQLNSHEDNSVIWIDMESGVRTENELDLSKVEKILEISEPFTQYTTHD